jgi:hypothetical protein
MHGETLESVLNALPNRSDPENVPDISGLDGIPAEDIQDYKDRRQGNSIATPKNNTMIPTQTNNLVKPPTAKLLDPAPKKAKIDVPVQPLQPEQIQAQLAEFQKRKDDQEVQDLLKQGFVFPPGISPLDALSKLAYRSLPPGSGPYATKPMGLLVIKPADIPIPPHPLSLTTTTSLSIADGKSDKFVPPHPQTNSLPASAYPSSVVSKSVFFPCGR